MGFSFNQTQSGTYGLVLGENNGLRRLMIVIGTPEAQSIAFKLHNTKPPRPLTHDLFPLLLSKFDIKLKEVMIYKYEEGVFFSRLVFSGGDKPDVSINSRTSDAIAIAIRTKSAIYTTEAIMEELAVVFSDADAANEDISPSPVLPEDQKKYDDYSIFNEVELEILLQEAIVGEDYELASVLRDELGRRKGS